MSSPTVLRGMTWSHTRGYLPLVATAQRFSELNPGVEIRWEKRSLKAFEEVPVHQLAAEYDLLVIDHPFIGEAAARRVFLPLDEHLPAAFIADQAAHSAGASHASYLWDNHLWSLAIDAATPVAAWRPDLLAKLGLSLPKTWNEVLALAQHQAVEVPGAPINCLMNFYGLCATLGEAPFSSADRVVSREIGAAALDLLRGLLQHCDLGCFSRNPIQSLDRLAARENQTVVYCLFPYGYSNYAQEGYAANTLQFGDVPSLNGKPIVTTLGGTGLAISARTRAAKIAAAYAQFVASPEIQRTLYTRSGGQPGHRSAWLDPENNRRANLYFSATLPTIDRAYLRPRYAGYLHRFQEPAGPVVHRFVRGEASERETLDTLDQIYRASRASDFSVHHASA